MTDTTVAGPTLSATPAGPTLSAWQKASGSRIGRWLFAQSICRRAPYFASIKPRFLELRPTLCRVSFANRKSVRNHLGTIHALAMGNLCELAAGMVTEVTVPTNMSWVPRGMTIEYLRRAESEVTATARLDKTEWTQAQNVAVPITVVDRNGTEVVRAVITMYVSSRPRPQGDPARSP